jgi:hypothetical protein
VPYTKRGNKNQLRSPISGKSNGVLGQKQAQPPVYDYNVPGPLYKENVVELSPKNTEKMKLDVRG